MTSSVRAQRLLALLERRGFAALLAGVFVIGVGVLAYVAHSPGDALSVLFVVPVAIVAISFGARAGLGAALAASLLVVGIYELQGSIDPIGYATRVTTLLVVGGLVGVFVDTARALREELARYHEISLDLLVIADLEGNFTYVNPAWERTLGHTAEELLSQPYVSFVHPDDVAATSDAASELEAAEAELTCFRNRYRTADGSYRWLEWASKTYGDRIYGSARDVTSAVEAEEVRASYSQLLERQVAERTREVDEARFETLRCLARAAEYRDDETRQHTNRVGDLSARVALELGLDEAYVELVREAAPLHDIGKLGVADAILLKPGRLTPEERAVMQRHVAMGCAILEDTDSAVLRLATEIVATHHEWWDGSGYPRGLKGEDIPLSGRIVALADVYDALTHERPYKRAWPEARALDEIRSLSGSHFDPDVVAAFEEAVSPGLRLAAGS